MSIFRRLPDELGQITDRAKSNLAWFSYFAGGFSFFYAAVCFFHLKHTPSGIQMMASGVIFFIIPWLIRKEVSLRLLTYIYLIAGGICVYYNTYLRGGIYDPVIAWSIFIPLIPLLILGVRDALIWLGITCTIVIFFYILHATGLKDEQVSRDSLNPFFSLTVLLGIIILVFMVSQTFNDSKNVALIALNDNNKKLDKAKEELLIAQKYKDLFLANVSHELRTPMSIIIGLSDMLRLRESDPQNKKLLEGMHDSAERLLLLINDILDVSKLRTSSLSVNNETFKPVSVFQSTFDLFHQKRTQKGLEGKLELDKNLPEFLSSDPMRISQVVSNLLDNAIKYSDTGCITLSVAMLDDAHLRVTIADQGRGISAEKIPFLFDPFYRVDPNEKLEGIGLGLAIVKQVVDALNGQINIESDPGAGTIVTLVLPVEMATGSAEDKDIISPEMLEALRGIQILVAEDILLNRVIIQDVLERSIPDCKVDFAVNGHEVIEKYAPGKYDIVLMDIRMPDMDGLQTTGIIRERFGDEPLIIALTANAMVDERAACMEAGMNEHVAKPIIAEELIRKMHEMLHPVS